METLSEVDSSKDDSEEDIPIVAESALVLSEKESDEDPEEEDGSKMNLISSKLSSETPLKTFIDSFKETYNISVGPNDIAIFV